MDIKYIIEFLKWRNVIKIIIFSREIIFKIFVALVVLVVFVFIVILSLIKN